MYIARSRRVPEVPALGMPALDPSLPPAPPHGVRPGIGSAARVDRNQRGIERLPAGRLHSSGDDSGLNGGLRVVRSPAPDGTDGPMSIEKIPVRVTSSGQVLDVVVYSKRPEAIQVVLGEGVHSVRCDLTPTRNRQAYAGNAMGREIVYERSCDQVKADLARVEGFRDFRR